MNKEKAKKYLEEKGHKNPTEKEIEEVMQKGKIYGDPLVKIEK